MNLSGYGSIEGSPISFSINPKFSFLRFVMGSTVSFFSFNYKG